MEYKPHTRGDTMNSTKLSIDALPKINEAELIAELDKLWTPMPRTYMNPMLYNIVKHAKEKFKNCFSWQKLGIFLTERGLWNLTADTLREQYNKERRNREKFNQT